MIELYQKISNIQYGTSNLFSNIINAFNLHKNTPIEEFHPENIWTEMHFHKNTYKWIYSPAYKPTSIGMSVFQTPALEENVGFLRLGVVSYYCIRTKTTGLTFSNGTTILKPLYISTHKWQLTEFTLNSTRYICKDCGATGSKEYALSKNKILADKYLFSTCDDVTIEKLLG